MYVDSCVSMPFVFSQQDLIQRGGASHLVYSESSWKLLIWFPNLPGTCLPSPVSSLVCRPCPPELGATSASPIPGAPSCFSEALGLCACPCLGHLRSLLWERPLRAPPSTQAAPMEGGLGRYVAGGRNASLCWHHLELVMDVRV